MLTSNSRVNSKSAVLFIWENMYVCIETTNNKNVTFCGFVSNSYLQISFLHSKQSNFVNIMEGTVCINTIIVYK